MAVLKDNILNNVYNSGNKSIDVSVQDQTTEQIDLYLCEEKGTTVLTVALSIDDKTATVDDTTGAAIGDCINIREGSRFFQSVVSGIAGSVVSFNTPCDYAFTTSATVCFGEWDLSTANGSITPVVFCVSPPPTAKYDIYDISISMEDNSQMYESTFAGITALTNGLVGRIRDGYTKNIFLCTNNGGFREIGFDTEYPDKVPTGTYAFWGDKKFNINNGVAVRIDGATNDVIEIIVQDDLTGIDKIAVTIHGHVVD